VARALLEDRLVRASLRCISVLAVTALGCSAEISPGSSGDRVGRVIQPVIGGVSSGAEHDGVVVLARFEAGTRRGLCSATLVAPNLLLTARHCVSIADSTIACNMDGSAAVGAVIHEDFPAESFVVFVGKDGVTASVTDEMTAKARGTKLVVDDSTTLCNHDLAFVLLDRPVDAPIATLRLWGGPRATERVTVVGWGVDATGTLPATRMERGDLAVRRIGPTLMPGNLYGIGSAEVMFGEAACAGDSGGPAFNNDGVLVGVTSRVGNGQPKDPANIASTCVGDTAHSIYTHLGHAADLVERAFAEAGNYPVVEPPPIASAPFSNDSEQAELGVAMPDPATQSEWPDTKFLSATANVEPEAPAAADDGGCTIASSPGAPSSNAAAWLVAIAIALGVRVRRRDRCGRRRSSR
jgi:MYXO-CTERM domain-containing protein